MIFRLALACLCAAFSLNAAPEIKPQPKPAPAKPEPAKPEPAKPEPGKPEPKPEPKPNPTPKPEPKPEPAKPAPTPAKPEEPKPEPKPATPEAKPETAAKPAQPSSTTSSSSDSKPKRKTITEFTKGFHRSDGLFRAYMDVERGSAWLVIAKEQLGKEFIYFTHSVDGPPAAGHNRGRYGDNYIFTMRRAFDRIEFLEQNTSLYFDPNNAVSRAKRANVSPAILASEIIAAEDPDAYLVSASSLFLKESLSMVKFGNNPLLGRQSETKSKIMRISGYPKNSAFIVEYAFENPTPPRHSDEEGSSFDITNPRYVSVFVQHTLLAMPEEDFKPRFDDPRLGYFSTQVTDMTSTDAVPYRDVIHRWRLEKQKPGTKLSEPVTPITFWIENTTPVEFRDTIRSAVLKWNEAFETAGFKDAVVVKQQPDDAKWTADDIEHNVLRWTSSVNPPFGGYGPSFVNPRTGEILGADIMLEYSFITKRLLSKRLLGDLGLASMPAVGLENESKNALTDPHTCLACGCARQGLLFGQTMLRLQKSDRVEVDRMLKEALYYLALHEVGHTLGLNHNFRGTQLHNATDVHNRELTERVGLSGSVMDYPTVNWAPKGVKQGSYYTTKPGPYDHWIINFGYSEALEDPIEEEKRLEEIASQSHKPELAFANDADDMRAAGKAIDPRAMIYDMSSDPVTYGEQRCERVRDEVKNILKDLNTPGKSWQEIGLAYNVLLGEAGNALVAASRYVGGVYVERAVQGQAQGTVPLKPVEADKQRRALQFIAKYAFAPDAFNAPPELYAHLQQQRRGFDHSAEGEDPRLHDSVAKIQRSILDHILHPNTLRRIMDTALYGNEVSTDEVLQSLTTAIFTGDEAGKPISAARQNLQLDYLTRLLNLTHNGSFYHSTQSSALFQVERIKAFQFPTSPAHQLAIGYRIRRALDESK